MKSLNVISLYFILSLRRELSAFITVFLRASYSAFGSAFGAARGWGIASPCMILLLPNVCAIGSIAVICAHAIPERSTSFVIAAPQRVHEPQVETIIAASTPASLSFSAMERPKASPLSRDAPVPDVL